MLLPKQNETLTDGTATQSPDPIGLPYFVFSDNITKSWISVKDRPEINEF